MKNYRISADWLDKTRKEKFFINYFSKDGNAYYCHSLTMLRVLQTSLSEAERQSEHQPKLGDAVLTADEYFEILDIYAKAYDAGRAMFRDKYLIDKNVLYSSNADAYIRQLDKNLNNIWMPDSRNSSTVVSEDVIVRMGNAAGHWHELTDLFNENKELFEKYEIKAVPDDGGKTFSGLLITQVERTRLIEIHKYLSDEKYIDVDVDSWLYWFSKQTWINQKKKPAKIKWIAAAYHLTNVVYLICGNMEKSTETAMKKAFVLPKGANFLKMTIVLEPKTETQRKKNNNKLNTDIKNMLNWAERNAIK